MSTISIRLDDQDARLIKEYAKTNNITISRILSFVHQNERLNL